MLEYKISKLFILANNFRPNNSPPQYVPPAGAYFSPPPTYYRTENGRYNGFQPPVNVFPDQPPGLIIKEYFF